MNDKQRFSQRTAIRVLERACAVERDPDAGVTAEQVADAARILGISQEALLDSMSADVDPAWKILLVGRPSFRAHVKLGKPIARGQLVESLQVAGFGRGEVRESGGCITWKRDVRHEWVRVTTDGATVLSLTAHRSMVLGFVPWLGLGAGVVSAGAVLPVVWPASEHSVVAFVLAAVVGFSTARAAWNRILAHWRTELARCANRLRAELQRA